LAAAKWLNIHFFRIFSERPLCPGLIESITFGKMDVISHFPAAKTIIHNYHTRGFLIDKTPAGFFYKFAQKKMII